MPAMKTPLYEAHVALGARMAPFAGWDMPIQYDGILAEHVRTRTACSVFDTCHMGEFVVSGPRAAADLDRLMTSSIAALEDGQCRYGFLLNEEGGVLDDLTCYRWAADRYLLVVNAGTRAGDAEWIRSHLSRGTVFRDASDETAKLDVQGPASRAALERALGVPVPDLRYFRAVEATFGGLPAVVSRTGYTGEWGYEIYFPAGRAAEVWTRLLEIGARPAGLGARDTLRLEMGYPLYGHELTADRSPAGASRGAFVDLKKDFMGKARVERDLRDPSVPLLAGLRFGTRRAARAGDRVLRGGAGAGEVTSGSFSPSLGAAIAMAYVSRDVAAAGQAVDVDAKGGARLAATVVDLPFYRDGTARGIRRAPAVEAAG